MLEVKFYDYGEVDDACKIEKVELMDQLPENWTYPLIQPKLIEKYQQAERQSYKQI